VMMAFLMSTALKLFVVVQGGTSVAKCRRTVNCAPMTAPAPVTNCCDFRSGDDGFLDVHGFKAFRCCARRHERCKMPTHSQLRADDCARSRYQLLRFLIVNWPACYYIGGGARRDPAGTVVFVCHSSLAPDRLGRPNVSHGASAGTGRQSSTTVICTKSVLKRPLQKSRPKTRGTIATGTRSAIA